MSFLCNLYFFLQEKALVGAISVIVKTDCGTDGSFYSTSLVPNVVARGGWGLGAGWGAVTRSAQILSQGLRGVTCHVSQVIVKQKLVDNCLH